MYVADSDETFPPGNIVAAPSGSEPFRYINVASWKALTVPYAKSTRIFECPDEPAGYSLFSEPYAAGAWAGEWSYNDYSWADCGKDSPAYTGNPACAYSGDHFFARSYALNGGPFGVAFAVGSGIIQMNKCSDCNWMPVTDSGVPQAAETVLVVNSKNIEAVTLPYAMARCTFEMGDEYAPSPSYSDSSSPSGTRRRVSWFVAHNKGVQFAYADGHAKWMRLQTAYVVNALKYDCQRLPGDERTWPDNAWTKTFCGDVSGPQECISLAGRLVAAEHI